jgi:hypothetical protein
MRKDVTQFHAQPPGRSQLQEDNSPIVETGCLCLHIGVKAVLIVIFVS